MRARDSMDKILKARQLPACMFLDGSLRGKLAATSQGHSGNLVEREARVVRS